MYFELKTDCYKCQNKRDIPGYAHIKCVDPDPNIMGHEFGVRYRYFRYPWDFDPTWRIHECPKFKVMENYAY